ncbi:MAG: Do family serine endopeptidase [Candidatus Dasytiphilus stammeri]
MKKKALLYSIIALHIINISMMPTLAADKIITSSIAFNNQLPNSSLAPMLKKVMPSVVNITVEGMTIPHSNFLPPQFKNFFGLDTIPFCKEGSPFKDSPLCQGRKKNQQKKIFYGLGSGVIINANKGYIVTNYHVIHEANKIQIKLNDGRKYNGRVIGKDRYSDLALIQIKDVKNLKEISLADSNKIHVGDYSVAIGNPYGLGETVTGGIISGLGRTDSSLTLQNYEDYILTDAAINRGNSGGALVNSSGSLIGINTAIIAHEGANTGIGFAIPSNIVKNIICQILEFGYVKRGELGIKGVDLNAELAQAMNFPVEEGTFVSEVTQKSPADKAGIKSGDILQSINNKPIHNFAALHTKISYLPIGTQISLGILRNGKLIHLRVLLEESIKNDFDLGYIFDGIKGAFLGNYEINGKKVIKVVKVKPNTAAYKIGLKEGDIFISVNQQPVSNLKQLVKIFDSNPTILGIHILRGLDHLYFFVK